jgi:transposase-like protein
MPTHGNFSKIKRLPVFEQAKDLTKFLEVNFTESLRQLVRLTVTTMLKEEMETFRKQFEEKLYFNGYYSRNMLSSFGKVEGVPVPRFRQPSGNNWQSLNVFDAEKDKFMKLIEQMHLLGISQRKIRYLANKCFGIKLSANRVGVVYRELAEKEEVNINSQPLDDDYEYLFLDGIWEKTKGYGWEDNQSVLICALGVKPDGSRKILGFSLARKEDTDSWKRLLTDLKQRGLLGKNLKLVIADDAGGLKAAAAAAYPAVVVQNCVVHKMRNVLKRVKFKHKAMVAEGLKDIFNSRTKPEAMVKAKEVVKRWYLIEPKAMESLRFNLEDCFTYLQFPKEVWRKIRTTNLLEREFRELRRRMKVFDNTFQSEQSAGRYANTIINYLNQNYPLSRGGLHTNA